MRHRLLRRLLDRLDRWVERHEQYRPIGGGGYLFRMRVARYRGPRWTLGDGTVIEPGDSIGELHLDNARAAALHADGHAGFRFRRELLRVLAPLARDLHAVPEYRDIRAVGGATLFWRSEALAAKAGFERQPLPAWTRWWLGTWERILLAVYHPEGRRRLGHGRLGELQHVWVSRRSLLRFAEPGSDCVASSGEDGHVLGKY